jgi:hypothetical protein
MVTGREKPGAQRAGKFGRLLALMVVAALALGAIAAQARDAGYFGGGYDYDDCSYDGYETDCVDRDAPKVRFADLVAGPRGQLALPARCNEACRVRVTVSVDRRTAKRLHVARSKRLVGTGRATIADMWDRVSIRSTRAGRRLVAKRRVKRLTVSVVARDAAGNRSRPLARKVAVR